MPMPMRVPGAFAVLLLSSCATQTGAADSVGAALLNTAVAATVSGIERAQGRCFSPCAPGTACNPSTGFCEALPCRGLCDPTQICERSGRTERCVDARSTSLELLRPARGIALDPPGPTGSDPEAPKPPAP